MSVIGPALSVIEPAPQPYRFGWFLAWTSLAGATNPGQFMVYAEHYGAWGAVLGVLMLAWALVFGVAAAAVRPWAWYVVMVSPLVAVVTSGIFVIRIAATPHDAWLGGGIAVAMSLVSVGYFYRRRSLFESPQARAGFAALSTAGRRLLVASLLIVCLAQQALR